MTNPYPSGYPPVPVSSGLMSSPHSYAGSPGPSGMNQGMQPMSSGMNPGMSSGMGPTMNPGMGPAMNPGMQGMNPNLGGGIPPGGMAPGMPPGMPPGMSPGKFMVVFNGDRKISGAWKPFFFASLLTINNKK